jgi:hypothetical protein
MGCASCGKQRQEVVKEVKKGNVLKATLIAIDGVAVMTGFKDPNSKYLKGDKDV